MLLLKLTPLVLSFGLLVYIVVATQPPDSLASASINQIVSFFGALLLTLVFSFKYIFKSYMISFIVSLVVLIAMFLTGIGAMPSWVLILVPISIVFVTFYKKPRSHHTSKQFIPKLSKIG